MTWQPWNTAPKDGTEILAYRDGEYIIAKWYNAWTGNVDQHSEWNGLGPKGRCGKGAGTADRLEARWPDDHSSVVTGTPSYWSPLPEPPEVQRVKEQAEGFVS